MVEIRITNRDADIEPVAVHADFDGARISLAVDIVPHEDFGAIIAHIGMPDWVRLLEALEGCLDESCLSEQKTVQFRDPVLKQRSWFFLTRCADEGNHAIIAFSYCRDDGTDYELFMDEQDCGTLVQVFRSVYQGQPERNQG